MPMNEEKVLQCFNCGISCSMAVFGELAGDVGIEETTARRIAAGFGGGMGHGGTCGCVTGALMALGCRYGNDEANQDDRIKEFTEKKAAFEAKFIELFGSLNCPEMLEGLNPADSDDRQIIIQRGLVSEICVPAVCAACEISRELF